MQKYRIILSQPYINPDSYKLTIFEGFSNMGRLTIDGLVKAISFSGNSELYLTTESNGILCISNLSPLKSEMIIESKMMSDAFILNFLRSSSDAFLDTDGSLTLIVHVAPMSAEVDLLSSSPALLVARLTLISDWSDFLMEDLSEKTLEEMSYIEV